MCGGWYPPLTVARDVSASAEIDDVEGESNLAFSRGSATATFEDGATTTFKWMAVHRRQSDGSWKMARDAWNTNEPSSQ